MLSHKQESLSGPPHTPELLAQSYLHGSLQRHRRHNVILQLSSPRPLAFNHLPQETLNTSQHGGC